jgi:hypothetical protein
MPVLVCFYVLLLWEFSSSLKFKYIVPLSLSHVKSLFLQVCSIRIQPFEKYSSYLAKKDKQQERKE